MTAASSRSTQKTAWFSTTVVWLLLAGLVWFVFGRTLRHQFVAYDDQNYVYENPVVTAGLTANSLLAAFAETHARNWHPLTTISHMLDCELFGLDPAGHHLTNVLLHTAAVLLLFPVLSAMTGSIWRSAFVAAVFAIHPLRVESVAWVAERKDVLSAMLFIVTLGFYARYVAAPTRLRYAGVLVAFALGLMAKPMLVTAPLLLLLLDYWPLRRFEKPRSSAAKLILEKVPLLVLSSFAAIATLVAQKSTIGYGGQTPWVSRLGNAAMACVTYVCQMFWPRRLAVFYPQPIDGVPVAKIVLCLALLGLVTAIAWWLRKTRPYLIVGWLWYLICLAPTLGFIPVGLQAHADRYTYLPHIGLYLSFTWLVADLIARNAAAQRICALGSAAVIILLASLARAQTSSWRNTETLWQHAAAVTENNDVAHYNLALLAQDRGRIDEAIRHYESALVSSGDRETTSHISAALLHNGLGIVLAGKGRDEEAITQYRRAISLRDEFADAHTNLATLLMKRGAVAEAIEHYRKALSIPPEDAGLHVRLAKALQRAGQTVEARKEYRHALELTTDPDLALKLKKAMDEAPVVDDARH